VFIYLLSNFPYRSQWEVEETEPASTPDDKNDNDDDERVEDAAQ
jgi:hypothetical protein